MTTKEIKEAFNEWFEENVIEFNNGYGTQDAQYSNRLETKKDLFNYFTKQFIS